MYSRDPVFEKHYGKFKVEVYLGPEGPRKLLFDSRNYYNVDIIEKDDSFTHEFESNDTVEKMVKDAVLKNPLNRRFPLEEIFKDVLEYVQSYEVVES